MAYVDSAAVLLVPRLPITCVREIIGFAGSHRCDVCGFERWAWTMGVVVYGLCTRVALR